MQDGQILALGGEETVKLDDNLTLTDRPTAEDGAVAEGRLMR